MGHVDARKRSPCDALLETLSQRLRRPISATLLTAALSWRYGEYEPYLPSKFRRKVIGKDNLWPSDVTYNHISLHLCVKLTVAHLKEDNTQAKTKCIYKFHTNR